MNIVHDYPPHGIDLPDDIIAHEEIHAKQQGDPKEWWEQYLRDPEFRVHEELEAYRVQYQHVKRNVRDRNAVARRLWNFASDLSGPMYGNVMSFNEAMAAIRR